MKSSCAQCGAKFRRKRKDQRSCSPACRKLAYERSAKARARKKRYEASAKGKAAAERYAASSKGQARQLRHYYKDRPRRLRVVLKDRAQWERDVRSYAGNQGIGLLEALDLLRSWRSSRGEEYLKAVRAIGWLPYIRERRKNRTYNNRRDDFLCGWYWKLRQEEERRTGSLTTPAAGTSTSATGVVLVG